VKAAVLLENTGVLAYNGQAANLTKPALAAAAEIVSVEGRHAAWISDLAGEPPAPHAADVGASSADVVRKLQSLGFGDPLYGPVAFGTSARSAVLTDWPDGGFVGIHGTNEPALIPGHISHGCVRLRNQDIVALSRLMPVGTPVTIR